ncbi:dsRBD fold-containing protein, partial [Streptomyces sp. NPDC059013]|uniref:dsRBD fold-containing protein n=1 Tax=Streptomyces sp. NPDC059013 TaxID=3346697 RepID=UPI00368F747E
MTTQHWNIDLSFEEDGTRTACKASLSGPNAPGVEGKGIARRNPGDSPDAKIGEELAAARACSELAHELVGRAGGGGGSPPPPPADK